MATVMQTIRGYAQGSRLSPSSGKTSVAANNSAPDALYDLDGPYQAHIRSIFVQEDFAGLEREVHQGRENQARLQGGVWKLFAFYEAVSDPSLGGRNVSESDWQQHFAAIKKWIAAYPNSAAAHIALAHAYVNYAWAARGNGYAHTVSNSGWSSFDERIELAKTTLLDAARMKEKCPYWFEVMQTVALAQGWEKSQARELFDKAAAYAPTYYHFYREYANFLLPKWYGEDGETQAFAEEVTKNLGKPDSDIVYFEIASLMACQCDKERDSLEGMDWTKVKQGYGELTGLYGSSNLKTNRFAYMSFVAGDKISARDAFAALGDSWHPRVWRSAENFGSAKTWASRE